MRHSSKLSFIFFIIAVLLVTSARAMPPDTTRQITPQQWQQLSGSKDFDYRTNQESLQKIEPREENGLLKWFTNTLAFFASKVGLVLLYLILLAVICYIIYKIATGRGLVLFGRKSRQLAGVNEAEAGEQDGDNWANLLQQAIRNNDLPLAVRHSYKWLLQMLNDRQLIAYSDGKTNYEYYSELSDTDIRQRFRKLSRQYEYVHYGHYQISPAAWEEYLGLFNNLKNRLQQ